MTAPTRVSWLVTVLVFVIGLVCVLVAAQVEKEAFYKGVLEHTGSALMAAAIISGMWHTPEFAELFTHYAREILLDKRFLRDLRDESLRDIRGRVVEALAERHVENKEHRWHDFHDSTERLVLDRYLPKADALSGIYRTKFAEKVVITTVTLRDALKELHLGDSPPGLEERRLIREVALTSFRLVAPCLHRFEYKLPPMLFTFFPIPGFPSEKRVQVFVGTHEPDAKLLQTNKLDEPVGPSFTLQALSSAIVERGSASVWRKTIEYHAEQWTPYILNTMNMLTEGLSAEVYVSLENRKLGFGGAVLGFGEEPQQQGLPDGVGYSLKYDGWLLDDQGYIVWWEEQ